MTNMYVLIGRLHVGGKNVKNSWSQLQKHLNSKLTPIERTKAIIEVAHEEDVRLLKEKLDRYNRRYGTDFFIG